MIRPVKFMAVVEESFEALYDADILTSAFERWKTKDKRIAQLREIDELLRLCKDSDEASYQETNQVLAALSGLARAGDSDACTTLLWLFLGVFRSTAGKIGESALSQDDLEAEMLRAFWEEVAENHRGEKVAGRLFYAVVHEAWKAVRRAHAEIARTSKDGSLEPAHPELSAPDPELSVLLGDACRKGVICEEDARLILATRIDGHVVAEVARSAGVGREMLGMRRRRAEAKLANWLASDSDLEVDRQSPALQ